MRVVHNKLVRDKIPMIIRESGKMCETRTLTEEEYALALRQKLREEVREYEDSGALDELADILEVVRALAALGGASMEALEGARRAKERARGGFAARVFLMHVDDPVS